MLVAGYDLETTGLLDPTHRIIEAAIATYEWDGLRAKHLNTKTWRINPQRSIDAKARAVHGISESDLIGKPLWPAVAPEIHAALDACDVVVAHNGLGFDFPFTIAELERISHPVPDFEPFDTMEQGRWSTAMGTAPNLGALCWACGVDYDPSKAHTAEYDVLTMMECFFFGLRRKTFIMPEIIKA